MKDKEVSFISCLQSFSSLNSDYLVTTSPWSGISGVIAKKNCVTTHVYTFRALSLFKAGMGNLKNTKKSKGFQILNGPIGLTD